MTFDPENDHRITMVSESGCWIWTAGSNSRGYGRIYYKGRQWGAHRAYYDALVGEIPTGLVVCHRCDVPSCVNPDHLFLGTASENMRDMVKKGRRKSTKGVRHGQAKLTELQVISIYLSDEATKDLAQKYGVAPSQISSIRHGRTWRHVTKKCSASKAASAPGGFRASREGKKTNVRDRHRHQ